LDTVVAEEEILVDDEFEEKHIYDSSERYFEWFSLYREEAFRNRPFTPRNYQQRINTYKKDKAFWYVDAIQAAEDQYISLSLQKDTASGGGIRSKKDVYTDGVEQTENNDKVFSHIIRGYNFFSLSRFWIILLGFLLFGGILFLVLQRKNVWSRKNTFIQGSDELGDGQDIFTLPYQNLIKKAEAQQQWALAVRLRYLCSLKTMSEKGLINYRPDLTNMDYLVQLRGHALHGIFAELTRHYEYCWYGQLPVSEQSYGVIRERFDELQNSLMA
jgi:hypothetical protein